MLDAKRFITDAFGGVRPLYETLQRVSDGAPSIDVVSKWYQRGSIPGDGLVLMLCVLEAREGTPVSLGKWCNGDWGCVYLSTKHDSTGQPQSVFD